MKRPLAILIVLVVASVVHAQPAAFADAKLLCTLPWDADWVTAVSFVGNDKVVAGNKVGAMLLWNLPAAIDAKLPPTPVRRLAGHSNEVTRLVITPDQKTLISASLDHSIKLWNMDADITDKASVVVLNERARYEAESRKKKMPAPVEVTVSVQNSIAELAGHKDWVLGLSMTPDGKTLVSGADRVVGSKKEKEGEIIVWDLPNRKEVRRIGLKGWPWGMAVSPDSKTVIASERVPLVFDSGSRSALALWDADKGTQKVDMSKEMKERMAAAAYSKDGKWLAVLRGGESGGLSGKITLLDPSTGKKIRETNPGHLDGGTDLAFHPDGKHIFSAGRDTTVKIWRLDDGKHVRDLGQGRGGQFKDWICAIAISPDGNRLAAADMAGAVQIWALSK
jgi:WD40 repeat protein